jgi:hypothetical protein
MSTVVCLPLLGFIAEVQPFCPTVTKTNHSNIKSNFADHNPWVGIFLSASKRNITTF